MEQTRRSRAAELELGRFRDLVASLPYSSPEQFKPLVEVAHATKTSSWCRSKTDIQRKDAVWLDTRTLSA
ncbi:hypothetical protein Y032_0172g356 [Ancylostoma ceylanicum]|uniref:Uncharacterized protein n=1 Tax=Ancylostoma ceylanicum TaxID=53326 RepID=A0A016SV27_9BILA|nr:hypothetical protein Y032_0172g356 [Ancylostoma ceylanicum]